MPKAKTSQCTPETMWELERRLAQPTFRGVPLGSALAYLMYLRVYRGNCTANGNLADRARFVYHRLRPKRGPETDVSLCKGRVLVTWLASHPRLRDLVFPVAKHLGYDRCVFLCKRPEMVGMLPPGAVGLCADRAMAYDVALGGATTGNFGAVSSPS